MAPKLTGLAARRAESQALNAQANSKKEPLIESEPPTRKEKIKAFIRGRFPPTHALWRLHFPSKGWSTC